MSTASRCGECGGSFTEEEWATRHSRNLDDLHAECCKGCMADFTEPFVGPVTSGYELWGTL